MGLSKGKDLCDVLGCTEGRLPNLLPDTLPRRRSEAQLKEGSCSSSSSSSFCCLQYMRYISGVS